MKNKKVLITGAAGFIGFHLSKALAKRGDYVVGYDNFNSYYSTSLKRDREKILKEQNVNIIEGDLSSLKALEKIVLEHEITHVVNLAAQAGVRYSLENPNAYIDSNIYGFTNVLEVCRRYPHIRLTYASSSSVYGNNTKVPFSIHDQTDHQASLYGVTKKSNELLAQVYHHLYGIHVTGLRFFTVYGSWGRPDMAYYSFTDAIYEDRSISVFNHGNLKRDFTYIDDIIEGTIAAIDLEASCSLFNLGNNKPVSLLHFIQTLETCLGKKAKLEMKPMQPGDVLETYADISESVQILKFQPKVSIEQGLSKFVDWYLEKKKI